MKNKKSSFGKAFLSKKMFVLVAIAVCTLILSAVAFPALLTGASTDTDEWTLDIYGNANEDDTIDMRDVTYTKLVIFGKKPETEFADAFYDDEVDVLDVVQIKLIILGRESELTIVDGRGKDVTINKPVESIVGGSITNYEVLRALKSGGKLVGTCKYHLSRKVYCPELSEVADFGAYPPDWEIIYGLNPDLAVTMSPTCGYVDQWAQICEDAGITHVVITCNRPKILIEDITKWGYILDKEEEAEEFIDFIQDTLAEITEKIGDIPEDEKPSVWIRPYWKEWGVAGNEGPPDIVLTIAGGRNIAADLDFGDKCNLAVDPEWIIEQDPDVIITMLSGSKAGYETDDPSEIVAAREEIMNRPELAAVKAVKNGQVYVMSCDLMSGPKYITSIPYYAKALHPDLFEGWDHQAIHQQYVTEFQGLDFDVYEQGVWVYPSLE